MPARAFLYSYAAQLTTVEVNYTFRSACEPAQLADWLAATPPGFRFSFKAPQSITHFKRLNDCGESLGEFLASLRPVSVASKFAAVLFQLPPNFKANPERLKSFLALPALRKPWLRAAFEFRHESWFCDETYKVLRARNAALCVAESEKLITPNVRTASFAYYRLRQPGGYQPAQIRKLATSLLPSTDDTFVYMKHEDEPTGALSALALQKAACKLAAAQVRA